MSSRESIEKPKDGEDGGNTGYKTGIIGGLVAGAVLLGCGIASLVAATGSGSSDEDKKTMKAPGRDYRMDREDFEKDPADYFRKNRELGK